MRPSLAAWTAALVIAAAPPGPAAAVTGKTAIEDDWPAAVALAKQRSIPVVVDVWAPW
jgi:threonine/homoserine/homoserine lactone efflux protein